MASEIQSLLGVLRQVALYEPNLEEVFLASGELYRAGSALQIWPDFRDARTSYERALEIINAKLVSVRDQLDGQETLSEQARAELLELQDRLFQKQQGAMTILMQLP